ncbi:MAG: heparinase II/III family protein [Armatimonadetes bacterium]|nr:heparinase II/III family protein [Armatimonadota bacterium]
MSAPDRGRGLMGMAVLAALLVGAVAGVSGKQALQEQRTRVKHPVLPPGIASSKAADYEQAVSRVMAMSEEEMLNLIPTQSAIRFCGCPNCSGGQQENNQFDWSIERPFELRCKFCGLVYPNEKYAATWVATGVNALGEQVTYRYYFDPHSGRDFWFEAHADYLRRAWFVNQCLALAQAYHLTRKPEYARRAALILDRFAQAYPHMAVLSQWPYQRRAVVKPTPPYPYAGGKWGRWMPDEVPGSLPEAYDLIYESDALDNLSQQQGVDVRQRIENDFFRATVEYVFTFGREPTGIHLGNMAPFYTRNIIHIGRVIGEPEYVHWGHRWVGQILRDRFFYDGMWCESPSYHYQTIDGVRRVVAALKGYSDSPGYQSAADGLHLESLDLEKQMPFIQKARRAPDLIAYPDGRICPVHDSWPASRPSPVREQSVSSLLPGFGHASLGRGRGANQLLAQLHFSGSYGHHHVDNLHFSLFAKGSELLSDIGYTHTKLRRWAVSTAGHNTVAIDRQNQSTKDADGDLLTFVPDLGGLSLVEARGERAYPGRAQVYRRELLMIPVSDADAYIVDIFRVQGGQIHDWLLHGSADAEMTAACSLPLTPREGTLLEPGEKWVEPIGESSGFPPYGVIRQVRQGRTEDDFSVTFRYADARPPSGAPADAGVRTYLLGGAATEVFLARSPRVRPAEGDDRKVYDYWMPQLVARRRGTAPLGNVFAAVHEPFRPQPFIREIRRLPLDPASAFAVALEVRHGDFTDTILSTLDEPPYPERRLPGGIVVSGRLAVVRERAGRVVAAWLVDGTRVAKGDFALTLEAPRYEGVLESATRRADGADADTFVTSALLPDGDALAGQWLIVTHGNGYTHGYEIRRVERREGKSILILQDDHGLRLTGEQTEECYFPRRKIQGPNRFFIAGTAAWPGSLSASP